MNMKHVAATNEIHGQFAVLFCVEVRNIAYAAGAGRTYLLVRRAGIDPRAGILTSRAKQLEKVPCPTGDVEDIFPTQGIPCKQSASQLFEKCRVT